MINSIAAANLKALPRCRFGKYADHVVPAIVSLEGRVTRVPNFLKSKAQSSRRGCRFKTWVTVVVQDMGNTFTNILVMRMNAMEKN